MLVALFFNGARARARVRACVRALYTCFNLLWWPGDAKMATRTIVQLTVGAVLATKGRSEMLLPSSPLLGFNTFDSYPRPHRKFVVDLEVEAKSKNVSLKDVLGPRGKHYNEYGRTRIWGTKRWVHCCTYGDCRLKVERVLYQPTKRNGPTLTGFIKCKKHAEAKRAPAIRQGLRKCFSS